MSRYKDLDEYTSSELRKELRHRYEQQQKYLCDYCGRPLRAQPPCKFPDRHEGKFHE